jgi:Spy/CpxP family protein refolding chaperone
MWDRLATPRLLDLARQFPAVLVLGARHERERKKRGQTVTAEQLQKWEKQRGAQGRAGLQEALKDLNLTDDQKAKLKPLWQAQAEKLRELRGDKNLPPQEKMEKFKAVQDEMEPKLRQILTGEQFDKWQKQREKMRGQAKDRWQTK